MTGSISKFTVQVNFQNTLYDVEITPTLNGKVLPLAQNRMDQWNQAEKTHRLFSQKIVDMLNAAAVPADAQIMFGSAEGFILENSIAAHKTTDVWEEFLECLKDPASYTAGVPGLEDDDEVSEVSNLDDDSEVSSDTDDEVSEIGSDVRMQFSRNTYLNLSPDKQKEVRFSAFEKKVREHFKLQIKPYTPEELACFAHFVPRDPDQSMTSNDEVMDFWKSVEVKERDEFSLLQDRIRAEHANASVILRLVEEEI